jgi:hypothetical protein
MRYVLIFLIVLTGVILAGCGAPAQPTPMPTATPNAGDIALQMIQQQMAAEATQQVVRLHIEATQQVVNATASAQAYVTQAAITGQARMDAAATADQARRDVQATQQRIDAEATQAQARRDAAATADQAKLNMQATQRAEATGTAFAMTQVVLPTHQYWTQQAVEQDIVIATNAVEISNLDVRRRQQTNTLDWVVKYSVIVALTAGLILLSRIYFKVREIKNSDGDVEMIIFDNDKAIRPSLLPKPVLMLETGEMPDVTDRHEQSEIVRRDQGIRALANMPVNPTAGGAGTFNSFFSNEAPTEPPFEVVAAGELPPSLVDGEALKAIEKDWKDANEHIS